MTPAEQAREIVDRAFVMTRERCAVQPELLVAELESALTTLRTNTLEEAASVAERFGCGKPGCADCYAGAAAVEIRALKGEGN